MLQCRAVRGDPTTRPTKRTGRRLVVAAVLACASALAVWLTWPVWSDGRILNSDGPRNLLRAHVMGEIFLPAGHVDGWSPYWYLGAQQFLFHSYGYFFLIAAFQKLCAGFLDIDAAFKLFNVLPIVALPPAVYYLGTRIGLSAAGGAAAALASLALGTATGFGLRGVFGVGLLLQSVGIVLFALTWPQFDRALDGDRRRAAAAALLLAVTLVTHFITAAYALIIIGTTAGFLAATRRSPRLLATAIAICVAALLIAVHSIGPTLEWRELMGSHVGWGGQATRLRQLLEGRYFGPLTLTLIGLVGLVHTLVRGEPRLVRAAMVGSGTLVVASLRPFPTESLPFPSDLVVSVFQPRALPYACLFLAVFIGRGAEVLVAALGALLAYKPFDRLPRAAAPIVAALALAVIVGDTVPTLVSSRELIHTRGGIEAEQRRPYDDTVAWLREHVPPPAVIAMRRRMFAKSEVGVGTATSLINLDTGLYTLLGDQVELTRYCHRDRILARNATDAEAYPDKLAKRLRLYGVSWLLARAPDLREAADASEALSLAAEIADIGIYRVSGGDARLTGDDLVVGGYLQSPERMLWQVENTASKPRRAAMAVSYHPNWRVYIDSAPTRSEEHDEGLMTAELARGAHVLELSFERDHHASMYNAVSVLALIGTLAVLVGPRRLRRRPTRRE